MDPQEQQTRMWAMILHFSQFAGYLVPYAGLVVPIVIWQLKKNELPGLDVHGKAVTNWIISMVIYSAVCFVLLFFIIGIPLWILLGLVGFIYVIIGGIKASSGEVWSYPGSIKIF